MKFTSIISIVVLIAFSSCKKEAVLTKKDLLTGSSSKSWFISSATLTSNNQTTDIVLTACEKADIFIFKNDGTYKQQQTTQCISTVGKNAAAGNFNFNSDETEITLIDTVNGQTQVGKIIELTNSKFSASRTKTYLGVTGVTTTVFLPK